MRTELEMKKVYSIVVTLSNGVIESQVHFTTPESRAEYLSALGVNPDFPNYMLSSAIEPVSEYLAGAQRVVTPFGLNNHRTDHFSDEFMYVGANVNVQHKDENRVKEIIRNIKNGLGLLSDNVSRNFTLVESTIGIPTTFDFVPKKRTL